MALFERADERAGKVRCNICNVECRESSMMVHRGKCADRNMDKFTNGILEKCQFNTDHIVEADKMDLHLEFCHKRQTEILAEFQRTKGELEWKPELIVGIQPWNQDQDEHRLHGDEWNRLVDDKFVLKMKNMSTR